MQSYIITAPDVAYYTYIAMNNIATRSLSTNCRLLFDIVGWAMRSSCMSMRSMMDVARQC